MTRPPPRSGRRISGLSATFGSSCSLSTCSPWRRRRRSGTRRSTSRPPGCSAFRTRRATRSSSSWPTPSACCRWPSRTRSGSTCSRPSPARRPRRSGSWWRSAGSGASCRSAGRGTARRSAACWSAPPRGRCGTSRTVNEKVYTVSLLSIALVMWLVVRWGDDEPGPAPGPLAGAHRLRAGAHRDQPPDGLPGRPGAGDLRPVDRLAGGHPALGRRDVLRPPAGRERRVARHVQGRQPPPARCSSCSPWPCWATRSGGRPRTPLVYLGILAVVVGISLNYLWLPMRAAQYPADQRGRARRASSARRCRTCSTGCSTASRR